MWFLSPQPLPGRYCDFAALPLPPPPFAIPAAVVPPTSSAVTSSVTMRDCIAALALWEGFRPPAAALVSLIRTVGVVRNCSARRRRRSRGAAVARSAVVPCRGELSGLAPHTSARGEINAGATELRPLTASISVARWAGGSRWFSYSAPHYRLGLVQHPPGTAHRARPPSGRLAPAWAGRA